MVKILEILKIIPALIMIQFTFQFPLFVEAAVRLSVAPLNGGNSLRFGRADRRISSGEEVKIRINSSEGKQYQVYQRLVEPLGNERGDTLAGGAVLASSLIGSNGSGTLYLQNVEPLSFSDQLIYTSGSNGEGDSFTMVYSVNPDRISSSGNFGGKLQYMIRPLGGATQDTVILSVFLEAQGQLQVDVQGSSGGNRIVLRSGDVRIGEGTVEVAFQGNLGEIQVSQEAEGFLQNELLEPLENDVLEFGTFGASRGQLFAQEVQPFTGKRTLLYRSNESDDTFVVKFSLNPQAIEGHQAGKYRGRVNYVFESANSVEDFPIEVDVEIPAVFKILVDLPPEGLRFSNLLPMSEPQAHEVIVDVQSNLGRSYMVMQQMISPLTNARGEIFDREHFHLKIEPLEGQEGKILFTDFAPTDDGETVLYLSDSRGSSVKFKVTYLLSPYPGMHPGDYSTRIRYSLGEN